MEMSNDEFASSTGGNGAEGSKYHVSRHQLSLVNIMGPRSSTVVEVLNLICQLVIYVVLNVKPRRNAPEPIRPVGPKQTNPAAFSELRLPKLALLFKNIVGNFILTSMVNRLIGYSVTRRMIEESDNMMQSNPGRFALTFTLWMMGICIETLACFELTTNNLCQIQKSHNLLLHSRVKHPLFTGLILACTGYACLRNTSAIFLVISLFGLAVNVKTAIDAEENELKLRLGRRYKRLNRWMLAPGLY